MPPTDPPPDFHDDGDYAVNRSIGAVIRWEDNFYRWIGHEWSLVEIAPSNQCSCGWERAYARDMREQRNSFEDLYHSLDDALEMLAELMQTCEGLASQGPIGKLEQAVLYKARVFIEEHN